MKTYKSFLNALIENFTSLGMSGFLILISSIFAMTYGTYLLIQ
jgi:hypothetical protein